MNKDNFREVMILNDASDYTCMHFTQWIVLNELIKGYCKANDHHGDKLYAICESEDGTIELIGYKDIQFKG